MLFSLIYQSLFIVEIKEKAFFLDVIEHYLKKTGKCGMSIMKEEFYQTREAFAIPKGRRSQIRLLDQGYPFSLSKTD